MALDPGAPPMLPKGRAVKLPGRGTTFVLEAAGPPGAPVVLLLHGWTATAALNWSSSIEALESQFRVVALDHRGHGRGIRSHEPFRLEDCADDVAALAQALGIAELIAVGYSMGGPIATLTWLRHPGLVQGLVLCATAARFVGNRPSDRMFTQGMLGLSLAASFSPQAVRRRAMARFVSYRVDGREHSNWAAEELFRNDPATLLRAGAALGGFDGRDWYGRIDVPTAVVVTQDDQVVPATNQVSLAGVIAGAEIFDVAGGHGACVAQADRFVPALVSACQSVTRRAAASGRPVPI